MKRLIAKMIDHGIYKVIHDDQSERNPYTIYKVSNGHQKKLQEYGDLESCMYYLYVISYKGEY